MKYEEQICICGKNRNSYYKTDHDATAMCLKEDYYSGLGSNMHAAYNTQLIVSKGLILGVNVNQNRNDYQSLVPCLDQFKEFYGHYPKNESAHFYKFKGCGRCEYRVLCKARCKVKTEPFRIAEICPEYIEQINCARKNLLSSKGIEMRVNRSIQVEGDFGNLKQNLSYDRFRRRDLAKVTTEMI